jgi:rubrerythrin
MDLNKIYLYALQREHEGLAFFSSNAKKMGSLAAAGVFLKLAAEEEKHIAYIEALLNRLKGSQTTAVVSDPMLDEDLFVKRASLEHFEETVIESMIPDITVLRMAYLIERDFAEFYETAAAQAEGDAQQALSKLAAWERGHERLFKELHDRVYEEYMQMPWGG